MRDRTGHMKAPSAPRPAHTDEATARQVDLAASTFRSPLDGVLGDLKRAQETLAELQVPVVEILRAKLQHLHAMKSLGSTEANADAAVAVYHLAKRCGMDLTYEGERVALSFSKAKHYPTGSFRLRTFK